MSDYLLGILCNIGLFSFLALSAYLLLVIGEISFGQQAFFAISAYASGMASAMWGIGLVPAVLLGAALGALAALLVALPTLRLRGLYFAVATLAFAEMVRIFFEMFVYQVRRGKDLVGPNGTDGFRDVRYIYEHNISTGEYAAIIFAVLAVILALLFKMERTRLGSMFRMVGEDATLAESQGVDVTRTKLLAATMAGFIAGLGGALYIHLNTYVEPQLFNPMLGVHALAYGLIGGLGTALGPILGVILDIGFLESVRAIQGYRMIVFGGLVAILLIVRPRGLLSEDVVRRLGRRLRRRRAGA
ncbi:MAG: branched-chain amino acid ABC transporter permease [Alphaproteobacteria bacterium]